jgi:tetratricopeptide (TPR) repeat protein
MAGGAVWLVATLLAPLASASSNPVTETGSGSEERELVAASPEAAALVADAETAARAGRPKEAWGLFGRAWSLVPRSPLPPRGICRLALTLGMQTIEQRAAAQSACTNALMLGGSPEDMRNRAAAWVGGTVLPSMDDLVSASFAADGAARTGPGLPWGARARGDLALRLGDREMLDAALSDLRRVAPDHGQTRQLIALSAARPSFWIWAGRLALALALLVTAAHALLRSWTRRRFGKASLVASTVLLQILLGASPVAAFQMDDAHPEASVPTPTQQLANPLAFADLLTDLGARAEAATARRDHAAAARYYAALAKAVPGRTYAFAKLCDALEASGQREQAIAACRTALTRQGTTAGDYTHFVELLLAKDAPLTQDERRQVEVALGALESEPRAELIATRVRCNVAVHEHDHPSLEACTAKLVAVAPDDSSTIGFEWALALERHDQSAAERLAKRATAAGLDRSVVASLERATVGPRLRRTARALRWALEGALSVLLLAFLYAAAARVLVRARRRLASRRLVSS